ncbi:hypothetical protein B484DRAFT_186093 [Ochromonadaceae sp. CCMP2298]|nr:hypothetical protein B484DRAFT_186093 [Ochromonadaceae sp. CCMP2298]
MPSMLAKLCEDLTRFSSRSQLRIRKHCRDLIDNDFWVPAIDQSIEDLQQARENLATRKQESAQDRDKEEEALREQLEVEELSISFLETWMKDHTRDSHSARSGVNPISPIEVKLSGGQRRPEEARGARSPPRARHAVPTPADTAQRSATPHSRYSMTQYTCTVHVRQPAPSPNVKM